MRNPHAGEPFTADQMSDEAVAAALEDVSVPTLLLSCLHMTEGEAAREAILEGPLRPQGLFLNEVQGYMSPEDQAAARAFALDVIRDWRDRGCPEPEPVGPDLLKRMMDWLVCADVPPEYVPMMLEEMELDGADARATGRPVDPGAAADLPVVVIGCGMSGLLAAIRLQEAGFPYTVIEKNDGVGGTWWENRYPGARVDVGNHFYCYSFEPSDAWTEFFAQQPELQAYFQGVLERHDVGRHVRWGTEVTDATWDEASGTWAVRLDTGEVLTARAVISAVGQLNRPHVPDVPGELTVPSFHTARWDDDVDLTGKRVVMIGAGATGFQLAPAIADRVGHLTILQRTAQWMFPNPNYHEPVGPGVRWALRHLPFYGRWYRFLLFWPGCDSGLPAAKVDPDWEPQERSVSEINDLTRVMFTDWIASQVEDDPELLAKVVPDYPPTGKRTLQDNGSWLRTLQRDDVDLVRAGVDRLAGDGVVDSDGTFHPADVVVWATGFRVNDLLLPLRITGRDGVDLREHWGLRPRAYLGMTVPGFPNFFCLYGPGTNLASGGSLIFHSECEVRYVVQCLQALADGGHRAIEPRQEVYDDYYERTQAELKTYVWSSPHIEHNFYKNAEGDVHVLSPWRLVDFWTWTRAPDLDDYELS
ncbi:flavin-containing monooxygenase [Nocardioides dongkuii]|uniref:flavin-containing monooxygenase n=1 Tax=Nocardioides dongkuii TaxID=2760089 RepID=UPI0015F79856|nr:NAD(P)/FAD-dependent oxidoreductase [Nocardioides dongkuii]